MDGIGVPCAMIPNAQLCDVCEAESSSDIPAGLHRIPDHLAHAIPSCRPDIFQLGKPVQSSTQQTPLPSPLNQPAPSATFATHLAAASASPAFGKSFTHAEELGSSIHAACENLAKSCVNCWCNGFEYHSHSLADCHWKPTSLLDEGWKRWESTLPVPVGCCFYCGCPQKVCVLCPPFLSSQMLCQMTYISDSGQSCHIHDHESNQTCHWITIFKPLAFIVYHNAFLIRSLSRSVDGKGKGLDDLGDTGYARWLCKKDEKGILNLLNVLLHICQLRGTPDHALE
jgi:hypothetical protein